VTALQMGANASLDSNAGEIIIEHDTHPKADVNLTAFLVGENGKVRSDADMVFFNAPSGENGCATYVEPTLSGSTQIHRLRFDLSRLPVGVSKIVVGLTEDGVDGAPGPGFAGLSGLKAAIVAGATSLSLVSPAFSSERSIVAAELYVRSGAPKGKAVWQGYPGGLADLARDYGVEVDDSPASPEEDLPEAPPEGVPLVDLRKYKVAVVLKKAGVSSSDKADVVVASDNSGSNRWQFRNGVMDRVITRFYPVACRLDPDEELASFVFATTSHEAPNVTEANHESYFSDRKVKKALGKTGGDNVEPLVMDDVLRLHRTKKGNLPTLCLFITDGGIGATGWGYRGNVHEDIKNRVRESDKEVFWVFIGAGGSSYGALQDLDDLSGRDYDNSYFFAVDRIDDMSDDELYDHLLKEFAPWLLRLKADGVI